MRARYIAILALVGGVWAVPRRAPRFERVHALRDAETVFAYSRISPDGHHLVYASQTKDSAGETAETITVVSLADGRILFTEPGIDAYWSPNGERMIYLSRRALETVSIRTHATGAIVRNVAPAALGDYYSWGSRDGRDIILTIDGFYYTLDGDRGRMPAARIQPCAGIGAGARPLISKDARRVTAFVRGTIVVRNLADCDSIIETGVRGAKADFSWDGRYIAFHAPRTVGRGYEIQVIDLQERTVRTVTDFGGSSYFPSWTSDGRLLFRYDGEDYRGFMIASDVLSAPARPLPATPSQRAAARTWQELFPETPQPAQRLALVLVWGPWSAHAPAALTDMQRARDHLAGGPIDVAIAIAPEPGSMERDVARMIAAHRIDLPRLPLPQDRLLLAEAHAQNPTTLLFRDGQLVDRRLGAQPRDELVRWLRQYADEPDGMASPSATVRIDPASR